MVLVGDNHISFNGTLAYGASPPESVKIKRADVSKYGWTPEMRHTGHGVMALCDGSVTSYSAAKLREHLLWLYGTYSDLNNQIDLRVPQYSSQGITY
jgi:hypothetical protein